MTLTQSRARCVTHCLPAVSQHRLSGVIIEIVVLFTVEVVACTTDKNMRRCDQNQRNGDAGSSVRRWRLGLRPRPEPNNESSAESRDPPLRFFCI
jgi:hypothetical protein